MSRELAIGSEDRRHYWVQFRLAALPHRFTRRQALRQTGGSYLQKPLHVNYAAPISAPRIAHRAVLEDHSSSDDMVP